MGQNFIPARRFKKTIQLKAFSPRDAVLIGLSKSAFAILFLMLRHSFTSHRFLALLLPLSFLLSWAGCVSVCSEITVPQIHRGAAQEIQPNERHAESATDEAEGCTITAAVAVLEARQTVKAFKLSAAVLPESPFRSPSPAWATLLPEIRQNSPPPLSSLSPLFVRLCTFRI